MTEVADLARSDRKTLAAFPKRGFERNEPAGSHHVATLRRTRQTAATLTTGCFCEITVCPHRVVRFDRWCIVGLWSIGTMLSGAGGRYPNALPSLVADLTALDAEAREALAGLYGTTLLATHPRYLYLAHAYGLESAALEVVFAIRCMTRSASGFSATREWQISSRVFYTVGGNWHRTLPNG